MNERVRRLWAGAEAIGLRHGDRTARTSPRQGLATKLGLSIHVSHFPPGTSKWNKIEHRLFSFITMNWRGRPLRTFETVVNLIGSTTTNAGLVVRATLDERTYPIGIKISAAEMRALNLVRSDFQGDVNYVLHPFANTVDKST